jgi:hypothetical protein
MYVKCVGDIATVSATVTASIGVSAAPLPCHRFETSNADDYNIPSFGFQIEFNVEMDDRIIQ